MNKRLWIVPLLCVMLAFSSVGSIYAADTKLSALPSATLTDGDELYVNDGGTSTKATVAELRTSLGGVGFIPLDITSLREIATNDIDTTANHGGNLNVDSSPKLKRVNTSTDKALKIEWIAGNVDEVQFPTVPMPPDFDETADATIHLVAKMSSTTDTPTIDVQVFDGIGDTEMGGATAALSGTLAELTVTIANANITGNPLGFFNISLVPGAHGTDLIELYSAWIEYTRKASG